MRRAHERRSAGWYAFFAYSTHIDFLATSILILIIVAFAFAREQQHRARTQALNELKTTSALTQATINRVLRFDMPEVFDEVFSELHVHPKIKAVAIVNQQGRFLYGYGKQNRDRPIKELMPLVELEKVRQASSTSLSDYVFHYKQDRLLAYVPVIAAQGNLMANEHYVLLIEYYHASGFSQLFAAPVTEVFVPLALILGVSWGFWLLLNTIITKPIGRLVACVEQAAKEPEAPINFELQIGGSEIRLLAEALGNLHRERLAYEDNIRQLAYYDSLTGLANRVAIIKRLEEFSAQPEGFGAVILIDVDGLKNINDVRGFNYGDQVLVYIANKLRDLGGEKLSVGHLGSDLFVIIYPPDFDAPDTAIAQAQQLCVKLQAEFQAPVWVKDEWFSINLSIGLLSYPQNQGRADDILRHCEVAVHQAKEKGGNQITLYDDQYQAHLEQNFIIHSGLLNALKEDQLSLFLQAKYNADTSLAGAEALLRWQHPEKGMISPGLFIPIAEKSDLIIELGDWVLTQSLAWLESTPVEDSFQLSVNISPRQFMRTDFATKLEALMAKYHTRPSQLVLEVTESLFIDDIDEVKQKMLSLTELGVQFSIDDFGTGYSSLAYIRSLLCRS